MSIVATDIYTAVECAFTVKRIDALPKLPVTCPSTGQRFGAELHGTSPPCGVTRQAKSNADRGRAAQRRTTQGV